MITLKKARKKDCRFIFQLRNHPKVREHFFDDREIDYSEHKKWFENNLQRDDRIILLAYNKSKAIGVIRFDLVKADLQVAEIDIYVAPELQGQGLGKNILLEGENWVRKNTQFKELIARVKDENQASVKMFTRCGFSINYILFRKNLVKDKIGHLKE